MSSPPKYIMELSRGRKEFGNKAQNLFFLNKLGLKVPLAYVIDFTAYMDFKRNPNYTLARIREELVILLSNEKSYAVRSSTNLEDSTQYSYAGQFRTVLNVKNVNEIINAILMIWESSENSDVVNYPNGETLHNAPIKTSILIQEMINPEYSGVIFTKNPVSGLDEVVVEVVKGLGTSLVQDGVTPERWVFKWGGWREKPEDPFIDEAMVRRLVNEAKQIEKKYRKPVDLEFAYDGEIYWIQLREITTIKELKLYSNKIAREMIPGIILPLVWSINIPINERSWKIILRDLFGSSVDLLNAKLAKQFYYRAYFNMGLFGDLFSLLGMPRESIELIIGVEVAGKEKPSFKPSISSLRYAIPIMLFSMSITRLPHRINNYILDQKRFLSYMRETNPDKLSMEKRIETLEKLLEVGVKSSYLVTLTQMLFSMFSMMSKNKDIIIENKLDSNQRLGQLSILYQNLSLEEKQIVEGCAYTDDLGRSGPLSSFRAEFNSFLEDFGHYSEHSNDLSFVTWRERPAQVVELIKKVPLETRNPKSTKPKINESSIVYKYKLFRETVTYLYTQNYSFFRPIFLSISRKLVQDGILKKEDDVFYLTFDEIKGIINGVNADYDSIVTRRRWEIENVKNIVSPELIFSDNDPPIIKQPTNIRLLRGTPASGGRVFGRVKIVKTFEDVHDVSEGDIIVIPYSDVSWTTLFHKVKGIISESGGILSHCAIVARECKIPAVVSVKDALSLKDGSQVFIDGDLGEITVG